MRAKAQKDPIIEEVRQIRKQLDKEYDKDPKGFMERGTKRALELGFKFVPGLSKTKKPRCSK